MGTYGSILSKDAISHGRDKGIPNDRKRRGREMMIKKVIYVEVINNEKSI